MDLQVKVFNEKVEKLLDEGDEMKEMLEKLGWRWIGSGYSFCDNCRDLTFYRPKSRGK